jgi:microsomal epoxide hydrolase
MVGSLGFGTGVTTETVDFWKNTLKDVYKGDEGRKKVRMAVICLLERDGLLLRLGSITCPVYWLQVSSCFSPLGWLLPDLHANN